MLLLISLDTPLFWDSNRASTDSYAPKTNIRRSKSAEALALCQATNFNKDFCILIYRVIHFGRKRFFINDLKAETIKNSFLISHGFRNCICG
jgi:hypothetical protein